MHTRREFLAISAGAAFGVSTGAAAWLQDVAGRGSGKPLKILILGGTAFLGPELVEAAQRRGHALTLFNRGKTNPQLFPDIEKLRGDRKDDLKSLEGRQWDAVIDTSGYVPRHVKMSAELLAPNVRQYVFISTVSVYERNDQPGADESAPVGKLEDPTVEQVNGETYGPLKALCEQAAEAAMPGRVTNVRPGLIVGPGDPTDRFTYWPVRVSRGGEVLAPGTPDDPVQIIDVRDLAEWVIQLVETQTMGVFNAVGPVMTMGRMLDACKQGTGSDAGFTWVDADFLATREIHPWAHMPAWFPPRGEMAGFGQRSNKKAVERGLKFRQVADTARDTVAWFKTLPPERQEKMKAGISAAREQDVLRAWHERKS